jgi:hypothetical protein
MPGNYFSVWQFREQSGWDWIIEKAGFGEGPQQLFLGRNRYEVDPEWDDYQFAGIVVIFAEPLPGVPEPGTLGLAALGLTGAWTARRLRRHKM